MGRRRPSLGMKFSPTAARLPAIKSQYLKKNSRARLITMAAATAILAAPSRPCALKRPTRSPSA